MLLGARRPDEEVQRAGRGEDGREDPQEPGGPHLPAGPGASGGDETNQDLKKSHGI